MGVTAFLFSGQGAQYGGMGKALYESSAAAREVFDRGEGIRAGIRDKCFYAPKEELSQTIHAQPCLFLTGLACAAAAREGGMEVQMTAGFSLGEIAALAFSGVLSFEDAFRLVLKRAEWMQECARKTKGGMAAVLALPAERVEELCRARGQVYPVNYNCPGQIAVAGEEAALDGLLSDVKKERGKGIRLAVSGAFHSPFMQEASVRLAEELEGYRFRAPEIPLYSNVTAEPYPDDPLEYAALIASQVSSPVRWEDLIRRMHAAGADTFIEVGAGKTLSGFLPKIIGDTVAMNVEKPEDIAAVREKMGISGRNLSKGEK